MKLKKILLTAATYVTVAALAIGGTVAYLTSKDSDVNVMTLGNVEIVQHEYEREVDANGDYVTYTETERSGNPTGYKLKEFTQEKPIYPAVGTADWDATKVYFAQLSDESTLGTQSVFSKPENAIDKFVFVENTGKSDAYVRTIIAFEVGTAQNVIGDPNTAETNLIMMNYNNVGWTRNFIGEATIDGNNYYIVEFIYDGVNGANGKHPDGIVHSGEYTYCSLAQVYMTSKATNEDVEAIDGNGNGTYDILVYSQAVQVAGFENAETALDTAFGDITTTNHPWLDTPIYFPGYVYNEEQFLEAVAEGTSIKLGASFDISETLTIDKNIVVNGNGFEIKRADGFDGSILKVANDTTVELTNLTLNGGAVWENGGNVGKTTTGALVETASNGKIVLNDGAVLKNNDGASAVNLGTRIGAELILNGGEIVYNRSGAGAVWGGGNITVNKGKISYNSSTGLAGAIRMVSNCNLTMNGGEISYNKAATDGGAIWGYGASTYNFNGGKISNNEAGGTGGAIYSGTYSVFNFGGDFELCDNKAANSGAIRFTDHTSLKMTGGKVSGNTAGGVSNAFDTWNTSMVLTGGQIDDNFTFTGGLGLTIGAADINGIISYNQGTVHNTAYLNADFGTIEFKTNVDASNFASFNFKPAADYTYTEGDEAKLVCLNEGYETYWDASTGTFRLKAI